MILVLISVRLAMWYKYPQNMRCARQGLGFRVQGFRLVFRVQGLGLGFRVYVLGFRVSGLRGS